MFDRDSNLINNYSETCPFVKEIKNTGDTRKIRIITSKGYFIGIIILIIIQVILMIIALATISDDKSLKIMICTIELPIIVLFVFIPGNTTCLYDYTSKTFSSYISLLIPLPFHYFSTKLNFNEISGFYIKKVKTVTKKYYKIGIKNEDGKEIIIAMGQDIKCDTEFDKNLDNIPFILRSFLKPGDQHLV